MLIKILRTHTGGELTKNFTWGRTDRFSNITTAQVAYFIVQKHVSMKKAANHASITTGCRMAFER